MDVRSKREGTCSPKDRSRPVIISMTSATRDQAEAAGVAEDDAQKLRGQETARRLPNWK